MTYASADQYVKERDVWVDPVSHDAIVDSNTPYRSFWAGHMYYFVNMTNKQTFDSNPSLWKPVPHGSENSANIDPLEEPE